MFVAGASLQGIKYDYSLFLDRFTIATATSLVSYVLYVLLPLPTINDLL